MNSLKDFEPFLSPLLHSMSEDTEFVCRPNLAELLQDNTNLVLAISHATPLSWLPAISLLTVNACARGGGARKPLGVMDRLLYRIPGLSKVAKFMGQTEAPKSFDELVDHLSRSEQTDLVVFPEGSNCFFGEPDQVQEFRSPRFVEIAVRLNLPILVCVHRGSESWARALPVAPQLMMGLGFLPPVASDFLTERLMRSGQFTMPVLPRPMKKFRMLCELYRPELKLLELAENDDERRTQLEEESERIRIKMKELLDELDHHETV
jgi:1-acyl-sn-glycerol-3-phosphate acyltransferase